MTISRPWTYPYFQVINENGTKLDKLLDDMTDYYNDPENRELHKLTEVNSRCTWDTALQILNNAVSPLVFYLSLVIIINLLLVFVRIDIQSLGRSEVKGVMRL